MLQNTLFMYTRRLRRRAKSERDGRVGFAEDVVVAQKMFFHYNQNTPTFIWKTLSWLSDGWLGEKQTIRRHYFSLFGNARAFV